MPSPTRKLAATSTAATPKDTYLGARVAGSCLIHLHCGRAAPAGLGPGGCAVPHRGGHVHRAFRTWGRSDSAAVRRRSLAAAVHRAGGRVGGAGLRRVLVAQDHEAGSRQRADAGRGLGGAGRRDGLPRAAGEDDGAGGGRARRRTVLPLQESVCVHGSAGAGHLDDARSGRVHRLPAGRDRLLPGRLCRHGRGGARQRARGQRGAVQLQERAGDRLPGGRGVAACSPSVSVCWARRSSS